MVRLDMTILWLLPFIATAAGMPGNCDCACQKQRHEDRCANACNDGTILTPLDCNDPSFFLFVRFCDCTGNRPPAPPPSPPAPPMPPRGQEECEFLRERCWRSLRGNLSATYECSQNDWPSWDDDRDDVCQHPHFEKRRTSGETATLKWVGMDGACLSRYGGATQQPLKDDPCFSNYLKWEVTKVSNRECVGTVTGSKDGEENTTCANRTVELQTPPGIARFTTDVDFTTGNSTHKRTVVLAAAGSTASGVKFDKGDTVRLYVQGSTMDEDCTMYYQVVAGTAVGQVPYSDSTSPSPSPPPSSSPPPTTSPSPSAGSGTTSPPPSPSPLAGSRSPSPSPRSPPPPGSSDNNPSSHSELPDNTPPPAVGVAGVPTRAAGGSSDGGSVAIIAGVVCGVVAAALLVGLILFLVYRKRSSTTTTHNNNLFAAGAAGKPAVGKAGFEAGTAKCTGANELHAVHVVGGQVDAEFPPTLGKGCEDAKDCGKSCDTELAAVCSSKGAAAAGTATGGSPDEVPREYLCPISCCIMHDPVVASDGHTYDRSSMVQYLASCKAAGQAPRSPITNERLPYSNLLPNHALRSMVLDWKAANPGYKD